MTTPLTSTSLPAPSLTVREAAERLGISAHTLRYYEREGLVTVPRSSGQRMYGEAQLERLNFLLRLRRTGMGISALRTYVALVERGNETLDQRRALLVQREQEVLSCLSSLQDDLQAIRTKIALYDAQAQQLTRKVGPASRLFTPLSSHCSKEHR